jgi:hypothetical protein
VKNPMAVIDKARMKVAKDDLLHIERHIPISVFVLEWTNVRDEWTDKVDVATTPAEIANLVDQLESYICKLLFPVVI